MDEVDGIRNRGSNQGEHKPGRFIIPSILSIPVLKDPFTHTSHHRDHHFHQDHFRARLAYDAQGVWAERGRPGA